MNSDSKNLLSLAEDLRNLYCKTQNVKIENLFIRIAQVNDEQFFKWLSSNRKIRDELENPEVYESLMVLVGIRKEYPLQPTPDNPTPVAFGKSDVVKKVTGPDSIARRAPYIIAFSKLLGDTNVSSVLSPFRDIISKYAETLSTTRNPVNPSDLVKDLTKIDEVYKKDQQSKIDKPYEDASGLSSYKAPKETRQQKKSKLFAYLFRRFSQEVSGAVQRAGNPFLSSKITGDGILADPVSIAQILKSQPSYATLKDAEKVSKTVLKRLDENMYGVNYEAIKMAVMLSAGTMSSDQLVNFYNQKRKEESKELVGLLSDKPESTKESVIPSLPIQDRQWLNPKALQMISAVLYFLYQASKMP
jgi:uncharacterized protein YktA (UPF0223 family)